MNIDLDGRAKEQFLYVIHGAWKSGRKFVHEYADEDGARQRLDLLRNLDSIDYVELIEYEMSFVARSKETFTK